MTKYIAESVSNYHPDKICDQISDLIVDVCLAQDPNSRVAVETIGGHGLIVLIGEVTTKAEINFAKIAKKYYQKIINKDIKIISKITKQSPQISQGVNTGGAGDQGIMIGYACEENQSKIPQELFLSRLLLLGFTSDAKSQVVLENNKITSIVLSVQGKSKQQLKKHVGGLKITNGVTKCYFNNTGAFSIGGFDADSGCTGRKIVVDAYGPRVPVGGGAFSGKDASKVDRSAAYMARWIALQLLKKYSAKEVLVKLGYVIGGDQPLIKQAIIDGKETSFNYDCRPAAIIERLNLKQPIYLQTAQKGHFGYINEYPWEKI